MPVRDVLSDEYWEMVTQAPFVAGFAVTAADPGGLIAAVQESAAMLKSLQSAPGAETEGTLVHGILAELETSEGRSKIQAGLKDLIQHQDMSEASAAAITRLRHTLSIVAEHAPQEYDALAELVRRTAKSVAEAAKEGGFLGFGGVAVSDAERRTLDDIEAAIAASAPVA